MERSRRNDEGEEDLGLVDEEDEDEGRCRGKEARRGSGGGNGGGAILGGRGSAFPSFSCSLPRSFSFSFPLSRSLSISFLPKISGSRVGWSGGSGGGATFGSLGTAVGSLILIGERSAGTSAGGGGGGLRVGGGPAGGGGVEEGARGGASSPLGRCAEGGGGGGEKDGEGGRCSVDEYFELKLDPVSENEIGARGTVGTPPFKATLVTELEVPLPPIPFFISALGPVGGGRPFGHGPFVLGPVGDVAPERGTAGPLPFGPDGGARPPANNPNPFTYPFEGPCAPLPPAPPNPFNRLRGPVGGATPVVEVDATGGGGNRLVDAVG